MSSLKLAHGGMTAETDTMDSNGGSTKMNNHHHNHTRNGKSSHNGQHTKESHESNKDTKNGHHHHHNGERKNGHGHTSTTAVMATSLTVNVSLADFGNVVNP